MSKRKKRQPAPQSVQDPQQPREEKISWIESATDTEPSCAIPVLPRYQADLPNWAGNGRDPDNEKWLGQQIWPPLLESNETSGGSTQDRDNNKKIIGEGRPEMCSCQCPGSVECVEIHLTEEKDKVKAELGAAFEEWKFDEMGKDAPRGWSLREEKRFREMLKRNRNSGNRNLVEHDWKNFRDKDRKSLVSYYFNAHLPRRIGKHTRSGSTGVDTDDDSAAVSDSEKLVASCSSRSETDNVEASKSRRRRSTESVESAKDIGKNKYLSSRR